MNDGPYGQHGPYCPCSRQGCGGAQVMPTHTADCKCAICNP